MSPHTAKALATKHSAELWYDRRSRLWVVQFAGWEHTSDAAAYIAPRVLRDITPELFLSRYLTRSA